jgi:hypothetical protein
MTFDGPRRDAALVCGGNGSVVALGVGPDLDIAIELAGVL